MRRSVETVLGAAIASILAVSMIWLVGFFPEWPKIIGRADFQPIWMWRYRAVDLVVLVVTVFVALAGASALFRIERSNTHSKEG